MRVNPDVSADTHPYISTGLSSNKFGINAAEAATIFLDKSFDHVEFTGVDMHIGSQITTIGPYEEAITKLVELIQYLKENGLELHHLDVGGASALNIRMKIRSLYSIMQKLLCLC